MTIKKLLFPLLLIGSLLLLIRRAFARPAYIKPASNFSPNDGIDACLIDKMRGFNIPDKSPGDYPHSFQISPADGGFLPSEVGYARQIDHRSIAECAEAHVRVD
jgi:hypothetical protein